MVGPTPVSALMHAATMVAAGVYMVVRVFWLFAWAPGALEIVAWIGGITAILAASIAFVQDDIKKILAYSTLSQLGYMVMACGLVSAASGMFHLTTHACFKALLFLGAGSVIHACHSNSIWEMGGLRKVMKPTYWTFLIGTLALAGIFPLAGFWSKDEILYAASSHGGATLLNVIGIVVAFMTAFYMGRCLFVAFFGKYRGHGHPHESPPVMWIPLAVLAAFSVVVGFFGAPADWNPFKPHGIQSYIMTATAEGYRTTSWGFGHIAEHLHMDVALIGTVAALLGLGLSYMFYGSGRFSPEKAKERLAPLHKLLVNKYYIDEFYLFLVKKVQQTIAAASSIIEQKIIIGIFVNGIAGGTREAGNRLRMMQTGRVNSYVTIVLSGITILIFGLVVLG
jgi:NADH-quinone oxidoreductase subunit L